MTLKLPSAALSGHLLVFVLVSSRLSFIHQSFLATPRGLSPCCPLLVPREVLTTKRPPGVGASATWVWIRMGCLEEGSLELSGVAGRGKKQQTRPRVYLTLCDTCFWLPRFPLLPLPIPPLPYPEP